MYLNFYNLVSEPFDITPDPAFLFLSPSHKEALASIIYGVEMRKGFVVVTGEVGTGKTTIIRSCLARIDQENIRPIYIFNPNLSFPDLLNVIFEELGMVPIRKNTAAMVQQFFAFLVREYQGGRNLVLIIDEAQNTPIETLEALRILSNLENAEDKLLQIVLVGQPELEQKLSFAGIRQLKQRIAVRATVRPLSIKESREYIQFRLFQVTLEGNEVFSKKAFDRIVRYAAGIPRVINIICDNALIAGFGYQENPVSLRIVNEVIADYMGRKYEAKKNIWIAAAALLIVSLTIVFALAKHNNWIRLD